MSAPLNVLKPSPEVCVKCKGRLWCGEKCSILERYNNKKKAIQSISKGLQTHSPPGVFVSWYGYPKVNLSPLAPIVEPSDVWMTDDTDKWFGISSEKIVDFRENLVRGNMSFEVQSASNPTYELMDIQETLMAKKPVGIEMQLKSTPRTGALSFSDFHAPMGPQADLEKFTLSENPSINHKIDYLVSDTDAKSFDAMVELFESGVGVNQLHKILSAGMLGVKKNRVLVPTRRSITAIDSNLSKNLIDEKVKFFPLIDEALLFELDYLDNHFFVLLLPREWSFEQLEAWKEGGVWTGNAKDPVIVADHEFFEGRKTYADNVTGAYYAARLGVAEYLVKKRKQAAAIVFREIGADYALPLGVWVIRENIRVALKSKPLAFSDLGLAMEYLAKKLSIPIKFWKSKSKLLDRIYFQRRIIDFA